MAGRQEKQRWQQELKQKLETPYYVSMLFANRADMWTARQQTYRLYVFFAKSVSESEEKQRMLANHDGGVELSFIKIPIPEPKFSCKIPDAPKLLLHIEVDEDTCHKRSYINFGRHDHESFTKQEILDQSSRNECLFSFTITCYNLYASVSETNLKIKVTRLNDQDNQLSDPIDMIYHIKFNCEPCKNAASVGTWGAEELEQSIITRRTQKLYSMKDKIEENVGGRHRLDQIITLLVVNDIVKPEEAANISGNTHKPVIELFRHLIHQDHGIDRCIKALEVNENFVVLAGILREVLTEF